jgi:hypothetical protein
MAAAEAGSTLALLNTGFETFHADRYFENVNCWVFLGGRGSVNVFDAG